MEKCIFCEPEEIIMENRLAWAKYDKYPVSTGHILIEYSGAAEPQFR